MSASTTLTVRLPAEIKEKLTLLAEKTRRSNSFLAGEAIDAYVRRELELVAGIEEGRADVRAGRTYAHEEVIADARAAIRAAAQRQSLKKRAG
jgi:predicted transcriptional regulator